MVRKHHSGTHTFDDTEHESVNADDIISGYPIRDVRTYGVVGDGQTDDTEALGQALADPGVVWIPSHVTAAVSRVNVQASPMLLTGGGTIKHLSGTRDETSFIVRVLEDDVTIRGIEIDGNDANVTADLAHGIESWGDNVMIEDCRIHDTAGLGAGIYTTSQGGNQGAYWNLIERTGGPGIRSETAGHMSIVSNVVQEAGEKAVSGLGGGSITVRGGELSTTSAYDANDTLLIDGGYSTRYDSVIIDEVTLRGDPQSNELKVEVADYAYVSNVHSKVGPDTNTQNGVRVSDLTQATFENVKVNDTFLAASDAGAIDELFLQNVTAPNEDLSGATAVEAVGFGVGTA